LRTRLRTDDGERQSANERRKELGYMPGKRV
jgi:hypothetical protein